MRDIKWSWNLWHQDIWRGSLFTMLYYAFGPLMSQTQRMELFIVTYQGGVVLAREVLHGLHPLQMNKYEYIQVEFDPRGWELVSSCGKIKSFTGS